MGYGPWREEGTKMFDVRESTPQSSGMIHPDEQQVRQRQQKACMNEQGTPD